MGPILYRDERFGPSDRWQVTRKVGEGRFAEVYEVRDWLSADQYRRYAVKIERGGDVKTVKQEHRILKRLQGSCQHVCKVVDMGQYGDQFYMVMELLGQNLAETRRNQPSGMDKGLVQCIALSTLRAIQELHDQGVIHRDVKPANFAVAPVGSPLGQGCWKIIDFGLARRYLSDSGAMFPERKDASFRGSSTYASVHAHLHQDLSRRDDLWSWFYMVVELLSGTLPWRAERDGENKEWVLKRKQECLREPRMLFTTTETPDVVVKMSTFLQSLVFTQRPDYDYLASLIQRLVPRPPGTPPSPLWPPQYINVKTYNNGNRTWAAVSPPPPDVSGPPAWPSTTQPHITSCADPALGQSSTPLQSSVEGLNGIPPQSLCQSRKRSREDTPPGSWSTPERMEPINGGPGPSTSHENPLAPLSDEAVHPEGANLEAPGAHHRPLLSSAHDMLQGTVPDADEPPPAADSEAPDPKGSEPMLSTPESRVGDLEELVLAVHQDDSEFSDGVREVVHRTTALEPVEAMVAMAAVFDQLVNSCEPSTLQYVSMFLEDMALFTSRAAKRARTKCESMV